MTALHFQIPVLKKDDQVAFSWMPLWCMIGLQVRSRDLRLCATPQHQALYVEKSV